MKANKFLLLVVTAASFLILDCAKKNPLGPTEPVTPTTTPTTTTTATDTTIIAPTDNYIPLKEGDVWEYWNYTYYGSTKKIERNDIKKINRVMGTKIKAGKEYYEILVKKQNFAGDILNSYSKYFRKDSSGYWRYDILDNGSNDEALWIKLPLVKGSSWTAYSSSYTHDQDGDGIPDDIKVTVTNSYVGDDTVTDNAGKFNCIKIKIYITENIRYSNYYYPVSKNYNFTIYEYYANNIGLVVDVDLDLVMAEDDVWKLYSYTVK